MNSVNTTYGSGGVTTRSQLSPTPQTGFGTDDLLRFAYQLALARRARAMGAGGGMGAAPRAAAAPTPVSHDDRLEDPLERQAKESALRRSIMENDAAEQQAPQRMVTGAGIVPGYTMDPNMMSAIQRKLFLPNQSQITPSSYIGRQTD